MSQLLSWDKETLCSRKKLFLLLNKANYTYKCYFRTTNFNQQLISTIVLSYRLLFRYNFCASVSNSQSNSTVYELIAWDPTNISLFKVNSRNISKRCEIFSKSTMLSSKGSECLLLFKAGWSLLIKIHFINVTLKSLLLLASMEKSKKPDEGLQNKWCSYMAESLSPFIPFQYKQKLQEFQLFWLWANLKRICKRSHADNYS